MAVSSEDWIWGGVRLTAPNEGNAAIPPTPGSLHSAQLMCGISPPSSLVPVVGRGSRGGGFFQTPMTLPCVACLITGFQPQTGGHTPAGGLAPKPCHLASLECLFKEGNLGIFSTRCGVDCLSPSRTIMTDAFYGKLRLNGAGTTAPSVSQIIIFCHFLTVWVSFILLSLPHPSLTPLFLSPPAWQNG